MAYEVLMVDDEPQILKMGELYLRAIGYEVRTAADGEEALVEVSQKMPDVVVLDIRMPKLDGFGVAKALRSDPKTEKLPIIISTADESLNIDRVKEEMKANSLIIKPYNMKDLDAEIKRLVKVEGVEGTGP